MSSHIFSLVTRATLAIVKQAQMDPDDARYAQATQDAADILAHLCTYVEALEACVSPPTVATIKARVSASHPMPVGMDQILED